MQAAAFRLSILLYKKKKKGCLRIVHFIIALSVPNILKPSFQTAILYFNFSA